MRRRSFLGALSAAPLAAKAAAGQAMSGSGDAQGLNYYGATVIQKAAQGGPYGGSPAEFAAEFASPGDLIKSLTGQLADILSRRNEMIATRARIMPGRPLDPDLQVNRSLALHTRYRIQAERDVDREIAREKGWFEERIVRFRKEIGL